MDKNLQLFLQTNESAKQIEGFDYIITSTGRCLSMKKRVRTTTLDNKVYQAIIYKELKTTLIRGYKTITLSNKKNRKNLLTKQ